MQLKKLKIKSVKESSFTNTHDLTVEDAAHYILENGVISHNSGPLYAASIILEFTKAGLKDGDEEAAEQGQAKSGIIVTSKVVKSRFARPIPVKFHISFYKGMNPYVGLENYVSWNTCGIERGTYVEEIIDKPVMEIDGVTQKVFRGKPKFERIKTGNFVFQSDPKAKTWAVKHLGGTVKNLFTSQVFTLEVLQKLDEVIKPIFELPKTMMDEEELAEAFGVEGEDENVNEDISKSHENLLDQATIKEAIEDTLTSMNEEKSLTPDKGANN